MNSNNSLESYRLPLSRQSEPQRDVRLSMDGKEKPMELKHMLVIATLLVCGALPLAAQDFRIVELSLTASNVAVRTESDTNAYYLLCSGSEVDRTATPIAAALGYSNTCWLVAGVATSGVEQTKAFYRVNQVSRDALFDLDEDGFIDARELAAGADPLDPANTPAPRLYVNPSASGDGNGSAGAPFTNLQAAIDLAGVDDVVELAPGIYSGDLLFEDRSLALVASGVPGSVVIDGGGVQPGIVIDGPGTHVVLRGLTIRNGYTPSGVDSGWGGGVLVKGGASVAIVDCLITNCFAFYGGGGIAGRGAGHVYVYDSTIISNRTAWNYAGGGGAAVYEGPLTILRSRFTGNHSGNDGGGLFVYRSEGRVADCAFTENYAVFDGGGAYGTVDMDILWTNSLFAFNRTDNSAAGLDLGEGVVVDCQIVSNRTRGLVGGAAFTGTFVSNTVISYNRVALGRAGGVELRGEDTTLVDCEIRGNRAGGEGGGVALFDVSRAVIRGGVIAENEADGNAGGLLLNTGYSDWTVDGVRIEANSSLAEGGGCLVRGTGTFDNCVFAWNRSAGGGGAVVWDSISSMSIRNWTVYGNYSAGTDAGGLYIRRFRSPPTIINSILWTNRGSQISASDAVPVAHSCVQGGWPGAGNFDRDPMLVPTTFRLRADSPCIDAGHAGGSVLDRDGEAAWDHPGVTSTTPAATIRDVGADEFVDRDGDDMADHWERQVNGSLAGTAIQDVDRVGGPDGLTALEEYQAGSHPQVHDTDGDGLSDGAEVHQWGTYASSGDTDRDGMQDAAELTYGFDPNDPDDAREDPDEDGYANVYECRHLSNPTNALSLPQPTLIVSTTNTAPEQQNYFSNLTDAIDEAFDYDIIALENGVHPVTPYAPVGLRHRTIVITSTNGAEDCVVDGMGQGNTRPFHFEGVTTRPSTIRGITVRGCNQSQGSVLLGTSPGIWFVDCVIRENTSYDGTMRFLQGGAGWFTRCTIVSNQSRYGAGFFLDESQVSLDACTAMGNHADNNGGVVYAQESSGVCLSNSRFEKNTADDGGVVYFSDGSAVVEGCMFVENQADYDGAGIFMGWATDVTVKNSVFQDNVAGTYGGGIHSDYQGARIQVFNSLFHGNRAGLGGAVSMSAPTELLVANTILWTNVPNHV